MSFSYAKNEGGEGNAEGKSARSQHDFIGGIGVAKAAEKRVGRQTPTTSLVLPYFKTYGDEAIRLYNATGRKAQEWQELMLYDILGVNEEELYVHAKFGYAVPRRNGKNEIVAIREMWGLQHGEKIIHTAHRATTSRSAWERLKRLLKDGHIPFKATGAKGQEEIRLTEAGGEISFRTRTAKGGLGEGCDLMIIDEAQEYTTDQDSALKYVVSSSQNPQTLLCGTPPTVESAGTVFMHLRDEILAGNTQDTGWAEWSVEDMRDPWDEEAWYETNPSLGAILTERVIKAEIGSDTLDFNIQRLGYWVRYNLKSEISKAEWQALQVERVPALQSRIFAGVKYSKATPTVALSIAIQTEDKRIFVEGIDCRPVRAGTDWIVSFLKKIDCQLVVIDGANGQQILKEAMKDAGLHAPQLPKVSEIIAASAAFEQHLAGKELCHMGQPSMVASVTNCEKRAIGSNGGFGYRSINEEIDVSLLESMVLAQWICGVKTKQKRKQRASC